MKKLILTLAALCASALVNAAPAPAEAPKPDQAVNDIASIRANMSTLAKERDDAKAQLSAAQAQQQQTAVAVEYYKTLAERNEALLRVVSVQAELEAVKKQLAEAQGEIATLRNLKGKDAPPKP